MSTGGIGLLYGACTLAAAVLGHAHRLCARGRSPRSSCISSCRPPRSIPSRKTSTRRCPASPCCRSPCSSSRARPSASRRAGADLYSAIHAWMHRVPGGLGIANVFACAMFAAMAGSSPATCSAIGSAGIPAMRWRGYSPGFAAGIIAAGGTLGILLPPSITMILYAVAAEQSLGRLFLAGIGPGVLLVVLFSLYTAWRFRLEYRRARRLRSGGTHSALPRRNDTDAARAHAHAAQGAAVRHAADRRHGGALWRLRHALGNRRPGRRAGAGAGRAPSTACGGRPTSRRCSRARSRIRRC